MENILVNGGIVGLIAILFVRALFKVIKNTKKGGCGCSGGDCPSETAKP